MNSKTKRANNQVNSVMNIQEQREMVEKANRILSEMKSFTWRDLETQGKFSEILYLERSRNSGEIQQE